MLRTEEWMDLKILAAQGHSIRAIVEMTGLSRNTIRRALRQRAPQPIERPRRKSKIDELIQYRECALVANVAQRKRFARLKDPHQTSGPAEDSQTRPHQPRSAASLGSPVGHDRPSLLGIIAINHYLVRRAVPAGVPLP
jgi:hypothetical protein